MIEQGLKTNDVDIYGQNAIYYSVDKGQLAAAKLLKQYGSDHDIIDENGQTPIYYAIKSNRSELLTYLLELGCNLQLIDKRG